MSTFQDSPALMRPHLHGAPSMSGPLHSPASVINKSLSFFFGVSRSYARVSIPARPCPESSRGCAWPGALCVKLCAAQAALSCLPFQTWLHSFLRPTAFPGGHLQAVSTGTSWHQHQQLQQQQAHRSLHGSLSELPQQQRPRALYGSLSEVGRRSSGVGGAAGAEQRNSWNSVGRFSRHALHEDAALEGYSEDQRDTEEQVQHLTSQVLQPVCCTGQGGA